MARIIGVLTDPFEAPIPNTEIRFSAITTEGEVFTGSDASEMTGEDGSYDFPIVEGRYLVEVLNVNEYHESGFVLVDEHTPTPITLTELVRYSRPYTPPEVLEGKPVWDELFEEIVANDEWDRQGESQVRDLDVFANEDKTIHKDDSNYMAKETHTVTSGSSVQSTQSLAYEDEHLQQASTYNIKGEVPLASSQEALGAYKNSDGTTEANHTITLSDTTGSMVSSTTGSTRSETFTQDSSELHTEVSASAEGISSSEVIKGTDVEVETFKYVDADDLVEALVKQGIRIEGKPEAFTKLMREGDKTKFHIHADTTEITVNGAQDAPVTMAKFDGEAGTIELNGAVTIANSDDFKGEEGWSFNTDLTYSNSAEGPWVQTYSEQMYRQEQDYRFKDSDKEGTMEALGEPRIIKLNALDGTDGDTHVLLWEYSVDKSEWHSTYHDGDNWKRYDEQINGTSDGSWSEPERMTGPTGQDGWVPEWERLYGYGATKGSVDGAGNSVTPPLLTDPNDIHSIDGAYWSHNWNSNDAWVYERLIWWKNQEDYLNSRHAAGYPDWDLDVEPVIIGEWPISPSKIKPEFEVDYFNGAHGSGSIVVNVPHGTAYPTGTNVVAGDIEEWYVGAVERDSKEYDIITFQRDPSNNPDNETPKSYIRGSSAWESFALSIDGNVMVKNTLAAEAVKTGSAFSDYVYVGDDAVTISGDGTWAGSATASANRFWLGHANPSSAPLRMTDAGYLYARDVDISGKITATSGTFSGTLNVKSASSGSRIEILSTRINVYEGGSLRVRIGEL